MMATAPRSFDLLLFDLGSTLIYFDSSWDETLPLAYKALVKALHKEGVRLDEKQFIHEFDARMRQYFNRREEDLSERTSLHVLRSLLIEFNQSGLGEAALKSALEAFYRVTQQHWQVEDDTLPTLTALRKTGYRLGLISNAADADDVEKLVDKAGVRGCFELILISAREGLRKPHPRIFQLALDHFSIPAQRALMVGDRLDADIQGAQGVGMQAVWITRRAEPGQSVNGVKPDAEIQRLSELPELLSSWPS